MLRSDAQRNKIYLMSFNLTVVLSQLLDRGRHMCGCGNVAVYSVCGVNEDVLFELWNWMNLYTISQLDFFFISVGKKKTTTQSSP